MLSDKKSTEAAKDQMSPEAILDLLPEINPEALGYLKTIRLHGTAFENSVYGDYLEKSGAITAISQRKNGGSCKYKLSDAANEWFDFHPEHDPQVKIAKDANDQAVTKEPPSYHKDPKPSQTTSPADYAAPTIEGPVRCVLFDSEGIPIRFGIIRGNDKTTYKVELPAEGRTASVLRNMISTESNSALPFWLVIPDTSAAFAVEPEFEAYLTEKGIDADELVALDPNLEKADLPLPKVTERPFARDNVAIGDVVYLRIEDDLKCGIFMGLNEKETQGALWLVKSDSQSNVLINSLESKWMVIDPSDAPLVFNGSLSEELLERLHAKSLELKENPIDPFPPPPPPKEEEPEPDPEGTIRDVYIPRSEPLPIEEKELDEPQEPVLAETKFERRAKVQKLRTHQNRPTNAVFDRDKREALADEWIRGTLLPMILEARASGEWQRLGSKGWDDMTSVYRVSAIYTGSPKRWYEALKTLTKLEKYSAIIGGEVTDDEVAKIKAQIEIDRAKAISDKKRKYTDDVVRDFNEKEIPGLIAKARKTDDWKPLLIDVLGADNRIRRLIELSTTDGSTAIVPFLSQPKFGLTDKEIALIRGRVEKVEKAMISQSEFEKILDLKLIPLINKCRKDSDFRALEPESLSKDSEITELIRYVAGKETYYNSFYRDSRIPLTPYEVSLLTASKYPPSRCEEILSQEILPLIEVCRLTGDYSPLSPINFLTSHSRHVVIRYLLQAHTQEMRGFLAHPRIGLTDDEILKAYGQLRGKRF